MQDDKAYDITLEPDVEGVWLCVEYNHWFVIMNYLTVRATWNWLNTSSSKGSGENDVFIRKDRHQAK